MKKIGTFLITLIVVVLCGIFLWLGGTFVYEALHAVNQDASSTSSDGNQTDGENSGGTAISYTIPEYTGQPYAEINGNRPDFNQEDKKRKDAWELYSELDELGRCGQAYANLCKELQPEEERGLIGYIKPTGWHTVKYPDLIEDNYLYNRCHLIAFSLAGEDANEKNLITGTRYMNIEGMLPFENKVNRYISRKGNHVLYRVTPVFEGKNLVASGVQVEAWSVEDQGKSICFNVYCFNVQPGVTIDYRTGDSCVTTSESSSEIIDRGVIFSDEENGDVETGIKDEDTQAGNEGDDTGTVIRHDKVDANCIDVLDFVLNTSSFRCHINYCDSVNDMADHNKSYYTGTIEEVLEMGYDLCHRCFEVE